MQKTIIMETGKASFGLSLMIHGAILILCIAVSSRTVIVPQKTVTVVLDSEIAVGGRRR